MRDLSAGPRVLLKRLRELMAEPLEPQAASRLMMGFPVAPICALTFCPFAISAPTFATNVKSTSA